MKEIANTETLAAIVSFVTETMLGIKFTASAAPIGPPDVFWKSAALPINGSSPIMVAVSADRDSCVRFGASMFMVEPSQVDESMIDDSLCELVNMTAGQLKSAMGLDQALGLPKIREPRALLEGASADAWNRHFLRAGNLNLVLSIATRIC